MNAHHPRLQALLKGENITYLGIFLSVLSLLCYLSFSVVEPGTPRPLWFVLATTALEEISLILAGLLCWRNWQSSAIPSGKTVWLWFALAMGAFAIGNCWFTLWEVWWGLDPAASAGNLFFVIFYVGLILGARAAIVHKDVRLSRRQWSIVLGTAIFGIIMAVGLHITPASAKSDSPLEINRLPARGQVAAVLPSAIASDADRLLLGQSQIGSSLDRSQPAIAVVLTSQPPPSWVIAIDRVMQPLVTGLNFFYVLCDVVLLIFAAILFLGFWGGHLGSPWRVISQAVFCFYIADTWFAYTHNQVKGYESGFIMEVFWIFGIVQFAIAAALEFDNSIRVRQSARRRCATN
jgi:hypothetical protein